MSLKSKVEAEAIQRAKEEFEKFLKSSHNYAGDGQRINLQKIVDKCDENMDDGTINSVYVGAVTFKNLMFDAFTESNMDYFKGNVEDDLYKGAMKGLEDSNGKND